MKTCTRCSVTKTLGEFYVCRPAGRKPFVMAMCRECQKAKTAEYQKKNKAKVAAWAKKHRQSNREKLNAAARDYCRRNREKVSSTRAAWRKANPDKVKNSKLRAGHGITLRHYKTMLLAQSGLCAACRTSNPGHNRKFFCVDHCHATGAIRGLLCQHCNLALGYLRESAEAAEGLAVYIRTRC